MAKVGGKRKGAGRPKGTKKTGSYTEKMMVALPVDLKIELERLAVNTGRTISETLRNILELGMVEYKREDK